MDSGIRFARCPSADGAWKTHNLAAAGVFLAPEACCVFLLTSFVIKRQDAYEEGPESEARR